jgi:NAD(P)H-hydrate epimerase
VEGVAVKADQTVTMALPKRCQLFHPAKNYVGQLMVTDIGIPYSVEQDVNVDMFMIENSDIGMPERFQHIHKYQCGKVAVLAGSTGFTGAASLTSQAAMSIGAGLVILGIPDGLNSIVENKLTEVITRPYHVQNRTHYLKSATDPDIENLLEWCDVLAIGPGLGRSEETQQAIIDILSRFDKAAVLDADALFTLANKPEILDKSHPSWILTPHHGEFYRFLEGISKDDFQKSYLSLAQKFAKEKGIVLLLKDAPSLVASPEGMLYVNSNGNPGLASGGTGDVLTGFVAGLMAQGLHPVEAAYTANFLHGACADEVAMNKTEYALTASDLIENIGIVIKNMF